jgi:putative endonuclease
MARRLGGWRRQTLQGSAFPGRAWEREGEEPGNEKRPDEGVCVTAASPKLPWWRRWFGSRSERAAARFLRRLGYRIVARNYSCPYGELDLVAVDGRCVVFVEVRSTGSDDTQRAAASVDTAKQRRLTNLALHFLQEHRLLDHPARFDVLALSWPPGRREPAIVHYSHAFEAVGRFQMYS